MLESYLSWIDDVRNDTEMEEGLKFSVPTINF